jgi:hypothetical protein
MSTIYSQKCVVCGFPARNSICSNSKCKSWKKYRQHAAKCKPIEQGLTSDNPIVILCPSCNNPGGYGDRYGRLPEAYCYPCKRWFPYTYIVGKWYQGEIRRYKYIRRHIGAPNAWEWETEIIIDK